MLKISDKQAGFSLVEVLVWIAIFTILSTALATLFSTFSRNYTFGERRYDAQQTAAQVLQSITNNLRYGNNYTVVDFEQALNGRALRYTSARSDDTGNYFYYIDRNDSHFYRVRENSETPELVPGHTFIRPNDIHIEQIGQRELFVGDTNQMTIAIRVIDTVQHQHVDSIIMVTPIETSIR